MRFGRSNCFYNAYRTITFNPAFVGVNQDSISVVTTTVYNNHTEMVTFNICNVTLAGFDIIGNRKDGRHGQDGGGPYDGPFSYMATSFN